MNMLKEKFLSYVEQQRSANQAREAYGIDDPRTVDAYMKANQTKREVLTLIEALEQ
jgi:hypothetical protein